MRKPSRWLRSWPGLWLTVAPRWKPSLLSAIGTTLPSGESLCMWLCFWSPHFVSVIYLTQNIFCPSFSFLYDQQSPAFRFYKEKVQECRAAASQSSSPPAAEPGRDLHRPAASPLLGIPPPVNHAPPPHSQEGETPPVKRKRKSRWGSEDDKVELPIPPIVIPQELTVPDPNTPSLSGT